MIDSIKASMNGVEKEQIELRLSIRAVEEKLELKTSLIRIDEKLDKIIASWRRR